MGSKKGKTNVDSSNIQILNDYCLMHIFEYLTATDKLNIEKVCKKWKELSQNVWCHYQFKNLCLEKVAYNLPWDLLKDDKTSKKIVLRLARYITSIDLSRPFPGVEKRILKIQLLLDVLRKCHKLDTFFLTYPFDQENGSIEELIKWIEYYAPQLTKFGYGHQSFMFSDEILFNLLSLMRSLKVIFFDSISGEDFLIYIPNTLEELVLENCGQIEINTVLEVLHNETKIETFCSSGLTASDELNIPENTTIKNLGLTMCFAADNPKWSLSISHLQNIEKLNVELNDNIDNNFLYNLAKHCQKITFLNFSGCSAVTDEGTRHLKLLPKLNFLSIANIGDITGKYFGMMPTLEVLDCRNCTEMTDVGLTQLLKYAHGLRILNTSGCKLISRKLAFNALHFTRTRENSIALYIATERTSIRLSEFTSRSKLLRLKYIIMCRVDCTSNYNGYFPTIHDFYSCSKPNRHKCPVKVYTHLNMD